jgi:hypothetical protein
MLIRFTKKHGGNTILSCIHSDGSSTWQQQQGSFFALHDLIHYAVETTLGYTEAFFGLLAQGRDIDSFGTKDGKKDVYTAEEGWAEGIVGLLQWPSVGGGPPLSDDDFFDQLARMCANSGHPAPQVTSEQLAQIRAQIRTLHGRWGELPEGETLELVFEAR